MTVLDPTWWVAALDCGEVRKFRFIKLNDGRYLW